MKPRIKIDSTLVGVAIVLTTLFILFPRWYPQDVLQDHLLDALGYIVILKGILLRMSARGHKLVHSQQSQSLVTTGPYSVIRNPMYLGSFMMGAGFVLILWPWWMVFFFSAAFYMRFMHQIEFEEEFLTKHFKEEYVSYCKRIPRLFPKLDTILFIKTKTMLNPVEMFKTKETRNLYTWLPVAFVLNVLQQFAIYHEVDFLESSGVFVVTGIIFSILFWISYKLR